MNIKDKILGKRISGIFNAVNILLCLFCIIYYSINANSVKEFNSAVDLYLVLAIVCCGIYVFADHVFADIFNLLAVVFITLSIGKMIVGSINTFADALNGISMFGSSGVIGYIIVTAVVMVIMLVLEIVSCFLSREKKNAIKVVVSEK